MSGFPAINATMVDQTMDQTVDEGMQIDSSSPQKAPYAEKWSEPFKWGATDDMVFDTLNPDDLKKKQFNEKIEGMSAG